jgi:hypothetical protein
MRVLTALGLAALMSLPALGEPSPDYRAMLETLHIRAVRPGADGMNPAAPNYANFDESRSGTYNLPDPLIDAQGNAVTTAKDWWKTRRPQIVRLLETEVYGREPQNVPGVRWEMTGAEVPPARTIAAITAHYLGHVDNRSYPAVKVDIAVDVTLPAAAKTPVPVMIVLSWHGPWEKLPVPPGQGPDWRDQLLAAGWGYAEYVPTSVQGDDPAKLNQGIIALTNKGATRTPEQWGALRAWGWGASRVLDLLTADRRIDAHRIGVAGHSRYGKAALVAMAFDPRIAVGYISSSGAGGAKLLRRNYGETLENLAGDGEHHWMAGNFIAYAGPKTVTDLPVDAHDLIALCAPRPVFISSGTREAGDGWTDPKGMFLAGVAAGPVFRLLDAGDLGTSTMPPVGTFVSQGALGFRQHPFGHTMQPNWETFLKFAKERLKN